MADLLVATAAFAAEQGAPRQLQQAVFAGRSGFGAVPAGDGQRSNALDAAGQVEHCLEGADDGVDRVGHGHLGRGAWRIVAQRQ
ncbi:hypothetical protein G6F59_016934 [Rhizopus arrhizus]|uniref:Uncharacterized protein n=1 Tax=Rhizopus delemar TaxID=936053 RepID=A0A9P7C3B2_9FUNG|nr:hypothetical protein G6F59_016934 [Rhizopus arrhizus]KAG1533244.1 hypothetical protein G6F50_015934 [Rhizopus delemar]